MKKFATMAISIGLIGTMVAGGSLAYLQDSDSDVNVMTLGSVKIAQHEYERVVENGAYKTATIDDKTSYVLKDFTQGKPLLPVIYNPGTSTAPGYGYDETIVRMTQVGSYGSMEVFATPNAQDKFVTVENTGKSDAYVRTLVAIEVGSTDGTLIGKSNRATDNKTEAGEDTPWFKNNLGQVNIGGNNFIVVEYTYCGAKLSNGDYRHKNGVLPKGDTTYPNLSQVYIKSEATNDDMVAIDGNGNGMLDVLVLSQAVQTAGFKNAEAALNAGFGEANAANVAKWFGDLKAPVQVSNADELAEAVAAGETNIWLNDGTYDVKNCGGKTLTINGTKNAVIKLYNEGEDGCDYAFGSSTGVGNVTFNGVTIDTTSNTGSYKGFAYMKGTFNNCNFVGAYSLNNANDFAFNNCTFDFKDGYFWTWGAKSVTFDNCVFNGNSKAILAHGYESTVITIEDCKFAATEKGYTGAGDNTAVVEIDPAGANTYTINFVGENTITDKYAGWTRVKDASTGHIINGLN